MKEITLAAKVENIEEITAFVEEILEESEFPMKAIVQVSVAIDEIVSNIAYYAYGDGEGDATVKVDIKEDPRRAVITFVDSGTPYNPLEKEDPDTTLSAEEREIGGLGIFMVKKSMDDISYQYSEGKNNLTITKNLD